VAEWDVLVGGSRRRRRLWRCAWLLHVLGCGCKGSRCRAVAVDAQVQRWRLNYGSRRALGIDLPSYPETTARRWLIAGAGERDWRGDSSCAGVCWPRRDRSWRGVAFDCAGRIWEETAAAANGAPGDDVLLTCGWSDGASGWQSMPVSPCLGRGGALNDGKFMALTGAAAGAISGDAGVAE